VCNVRDIPLCGICGPEQRRIACLQACESRRKGSEALSTFASQAERAPSWKEEVNQRLAAHKNRKGPTLAEPARPVAQHGGSLAAAAAARVAARYAKAPSYSEMLAEEARAAVRAAEAASRAALHAQAAAESVLAGLEAASAAEPEWEPEAPRAEDPAPATAASVSLAPKKESYEIRWEPELPTRAVESQAAPTRGIDHEEAAEEDWWNAPSPAENAFAAAMPQTVEPAQPIHANLIEFPREIVATRKARPHLAEAGYAPAAEPERQLSIFEVDPEAVSTQPAGTEVAAAAPAPVWTGPEWSGIELEEQPQEEAAPRAAGDPAAPALEQAPLGQRMLAAVVDAALVSGAFLGAVALSVSNLKDLPGTREMEVGGAGALLAAGLLYQILFTTLAAATPGMKYARLSLRTFEDQRPTRAQRCGRLGALLLSLLPVGLGVAWALFDEGHLSWHDRLSRTYLRKK
jgi:uncharacterized RDD family membrane protein YckC